MLAIIGYFIIHYHHHHFQIYRQDLSEFRASVLPREFTRTFRENPETHAIRDEISDTNNRYEQLKLTSSQHVSLLQDLVGRHTLYRKASDTMKNWLPVAERELSGITRRPVESLTEPHMVQEQIDKLEVGPQNYLIMNCCCCFWFLFLLFCF